MREIVCGILADRSPAVTQAAVASVPPPRVFAVRFSTRRAREHREPLLPAEEISDMRYLKSVGVGVIAASLAMFAFIVANGVVGVAATGPGGIGAVSAGIGPLLIAGLAGFVIGFGLTLWRQPA
jgi:hypothetical protein